MIREVEIARAYFKKNFKNGVPSGTYAIPIETSKGDAFMKVVVNEWGKMESFELYWDEALSQSWYKDKPCQ